MAANAGFGIYGVMRNRVYIERYILAYAARIYVQNQITEGKKTPTSPSQSNFPDLRNRIEQFITALDKPSILGRYL